MIEFRRSTPKRGRIGGRIMVLILAAAFLLGIIFLVSKKWIHVLSERHLSVSWLSETQVKINTDTTNFEDFASVLIDSVQQIKQHSHYIYIHAFSPKTASAAQIADFMRIIQALDDGKRVRIDWKMGN